MVESKFYKNKQPNKENKEIRKTFKNIITQILITIIIALILLIGFKTNLEFKQQFNKYIYNTSLPFTDFKQIYDKYFLGNNSNTETKEVFDETLVYSDESIYEDGVKLNVSKNYLVKAIDSGIVVYIGEKDKYGKTVIVQQVNGVDVFYGNINSNVTMYDYIEKGSLVGETIDTKLYLAFQKEGKFVNYKEYLK